jgi:hypothetical protein
VRGILEVPDAQASLFLPFFAKNRKNPLKLPNNSSHFEKVTPDYANLTRDRPNLTRSQANVTRDSAKTARD